MRIWFVAFLILLMIGCAETTADATSTPASVSTPTATTRLTATVRPSPTTAIIPTISPTPSPTVPPEQQVLAQVVAGLNRRDVEGLMALATEPFFYGIYGVDVMTGTLDAGLPYELTTYLADSYGVRELNVSADPFAFLPPRIDLASLNPTDNLTDLVFMSKGWGDDQTGQAALYFTRIADELRWQGMIVSFNNFANVPNYPVAELSSEQQAVLSAEQERKELQSTLQAQFNSEEDSQIFLNINPSGTLVVVKHPEPLESGSNLSLYTIEAGETRPISLPETTQVVYASFPWLDDERVLLGFHDGTEDESPNRGHLALLNTTTDELTILEAEQYLFTNPAVTADGSVLFVASGVPKIWRDGEVTILAEDDNKLMGAISADGSQIAFAITAQADENGNGGIEWVMFDRDSPAEILLMTSDATIAGGFGDMSFSPDGSWLVIHIVSDLPSERGVWIFSADGTKQTHLGLNTSEPLWLDDQHLAFTVKVNGEIGTHIYNVMSGKRSHYQE